MVTCWDCLKTLPYDCVCPVSDKTKALRWAEKGIRELELFTAILEGFIPTIKINGQNYIAKPKIIDVGGIELDVNFEVKDDGDINSILLDRNGLPLYRRHFSKEQLFNVENIFFSWYIGVESDKPEGLRYDR